MDKIGEQFLHKKVDSRLHTSKSVEHEQERKKRRGETTSQKPADKLADWMQILEQTHMGRKDDPRVLERIKEHYHKEHVIKPENIPQNYWDNQAEIRIRDGRGGDLEQAGMTKEEYTDKQGNARISYNFPEEQKQELTNILIANQKRSLDKWIDYLTSDDADYPTWAKYWAFRSITQMGKFEKKEVEDESGEDEEKVRFQKRVCK